ncbi:class I SAM-dependent methyltransferase [Aestuariibius sp. HNIBRBA575]|uniref:class I SAM-dependent methyltransferase n=1 Tax=Aestuariibius sp. HNIBRBA575 TaxID=3233343 RepID=UPI0034A0D1EB
MKRTRASVLELFKERGRGAEIGVFAGNFTKRILRQVNPTKLYLIDPWVNFDDPGLEKSWYGKESKYDMELMYQDLTEQFSRRVANGQVEFLRGKTVDMMHHIEDQSLDFVYVDGDHRYDAVKIDIEMAYQKVKPGGHIAVDDHVLGYWWEDGVVRAVNEFVGRYPRDISIVACDENQVVLQRHTTDIANGLTDDAPDFEDIETVAEALMPQEPQIAANTALPEEKPQGLVSRMSSLFGRSSTAEV